MDLLYGLTSLTLNLGNIERYDGFEKLKHLTSLDFAGSVITRLPGVEKIKSLTKLKLNLESTGIDSLAGLEAMERLEVAHPQVDEYPDPDQRSGQHWRNYEAPDIAHAYIAAAPREGPGAKLTLSMAAPGLEKLNGLTCLSLDLVSSRKIAGLDGLEKMVNLTSLELPGYQITNHDDWDRLRNLKKLTSLTMDFGNITSPSDWDRLEKLTSLNLGYRIENLSGLERLTRLTSLTLNLSEYPKNGLPELEKLNLFVTALFA